MSDNSKFSKPNAKGHSPDTEGESQSQDEQTNNETEPPHSGIGLSAPPCSASSDDLAGLDQSVGPIKLTLEQMQEIFKDSEVGRKIVENYNTEVKLTVSKELAEKLLPNLNLKIDNDL